MAIYSGNNKVTPYNTERVYVGNNLVYESLKKYSITWTISDGSGSGDKTIKEGKTAKVIIYPNSGYTYPKSIKVTGATYTYSSSTGIINLSNPTSNVTITGSCYDTERALCFTSVGNTTVKISVITGTYTKLSNPVEIDYKKKNTSLWTNWTGITQGPKESETISLSNGEKLYVWNRTNTLSDSTNPQCYVKFTTGGTGSLKLSGNIMSMLNYRSDLPVACMNKLFYKCTNLTNAGDLEMPSIALSKYCYQSMFSNSGLTIPPQLTFTSYGESSCKEMFYYCTKLNVNITGGTKFFTSPSVATSLQTGMFKGCAGTHPDYPDKDWQIWYYN